MSKGMMRSLMRESSSPTCRLHQLLPYVWVSRSYCRPIRHIRWRVSTCCHSHSPSQTLPACVLRLHIFEFEGSVYICESYIPAGKPESSTPTSCRSCSSCCCCTAVSLPLLRTAEAAAAAAALAAARNCRIRCSMSSAPGRLLRTCGNRARSPGVSQTSQRVLRS